MMRPRVSVSIGFWTKVINMIVAGYPVMGKTITL